MSRVHSYDRDVKPPPPYTVRPVRLHEAGQVAAMMAVCDHAVGSPQTTFDTDLLDDWRREDFDLVRDSWVIESPDGVIVGYTGLTVEGEGTFVSWGAVHPDHWGRGLGSFLIDCVEAAAERHPAREGKHTLLNVILPVDKAAVSLLKRRGYAKVRTFHHMSIDLADFAAPAPPDHLRIRRFDPQRDAAEMHELMETAFEKHWDYSPIPFERWWRESSEGTGFDPSLWWWIDVEGHPAGALLGTVREAQGWVMDLGVLEAWRGRGAGAALLAHAFAEFKGRGFDRVGLNVDSENTTGAVRLYERAGMRVVMEFDFYARPLTRDAVNLRN